MKGQVEEFVRKCVVCSRFKKVGNSMPAPLRHYPHVTAPFERLHLDLIGPMGVSHNGYRYVMTIIDVFTRYLVTVALRSKEATEVARALYNKVVCVHGVPVTIVTDQGTEFVNSVMKELSKELLMQHAKITAFYLSANGVIERANYTITNILRTLVEGNVSIWDQMLEAATFAYNTAYHRAVRETPFYLLFLRDPRHPYAMLESPSKAWYNVDSYKEEMAVITKQVYERCKTYLEEGREEMERYQKPSKIKQVKVGDRVFLRYNPKRTENKKLQPIFDGPYRVIAKKSDVVVKVKNLRNNKEVTVHADKIKILHENNVSMSEFSLVRKAYPFKEKAQPVNDDLWFVLPDVSEPSPSIVESQEDNGDESSNQDEVNTNESITQDESNIHGNKTGRNPPVPAPRYSLRSSSTVPEIPNVMHKPIEYC